MNRLLSFVLGKNRSIYKENDVEFDDTHKNNHESNKSIIILDIFWIFNVAQ